MCRWVGIGKSVRGKEEREKERNEAENGRKEARNGRKEGKKEESKEGWSQ